MVKKSSRGKVLEFRLKIPHGEFLAATPAGRVDLIFKVLARSVDLIGQLGISTDTQNALRAVLFRAENQGGLIRPCQLTPLPKTTTTYDPLNRLLSAQNAGSDCSKTLPDGHTEYWGNSYVYDAWAISIRKW